MASRPAPAREAIAMYREIAMPKHIEMAEALLTEVWAPATCMSSGEEATPKDGIRPGEDLEGRVGFEATTPGLKGSEGGG